MDDLEELVNNCPVSCNIDCGSLTRFDITISYQISRVPGLLDSLTVNDLNTISQEYLSEFVRNKEQTVQFFLENVELLSQTILSRRVRNSVEQEIAQYDDERRNLAEQHVNLWVSVAFRGFAINLSLAKTTEHLVSGIDSLGYSAAIRNSGNGYLEEAYAFSAQERTENSSRPLIEDGNDDGNSVSAVLIVFVVVFVCIGLIASGAFFYHKRSVNGLPCRAFQKQKVVERDVHSPESANVASPFGSMFSFDDTATAATNGLMRFIGSFSRSRESTSSPSSTAQKSTSNDEDDDFFIGDEETGMAQTPQTEGQGQADEEEEEEEEHPLAGLIPPMIVYDHIDTEEEDDEGTGEDAESMPKTKTWGPTVVPSRRVEANENLVLALGNRSRPSTTDQLEEYLRYVLR